MLTIFIFFFQAEDGIRDRNVTGVQTCALPISDVLADAVRDLRRKSLRPLRNALQLVSNPLTKFALACSYLLVDGGFGRANYRSEERRVGKECRSRRSREH